MAETYAQRKERERQCDAIREFAWEVAQRVAGGNMITVERVEDAEWPRFYFGARVTGYWCDCGMPMVPLPTFRDRYGVLPTWYCAVCNLEGVVAACERIRVEVSPHTLRPTAKKRGA